MIIPVILAGGSGSRLWPLSREAFPKQFIPLFDSESLFQKTLARYTSLPDLGSPIVICNEAHRFLVQDILVKQHYSVLATILEPIPKSTAPAIALAAFQALETHEDPLLLVLPADHLIEDKEGFQHTVIQAIQAARRGYLVTFGVTPLAAETGYGYIQCGEKISGAVSKVSAFIEKPDKQYALQLIQSKNYLWNSGMFLFSARAFLQELTHLQAVLSQKVESAWKNKTQDSTYIIPGEPWETIEENSIDYAIMEKTTQAAVLPLNADWNDVGSWYSLSSIMPKNAEGNTLVGEVQAHHSHNCLALAQKKMICALGVENLIIVETPDVVFVANKDYSQEVKKVVNNLKRQNRPEVTNHQQVRRPWGNFDSIGQGDRYQVKKITVSVGERLSLQMHHHRSEHWVVVAGTARVTRGSEVFLLSENQSTYIPIGVHHRLENVGKIPLEIIEVQSGSYLGEDDIIRFDDQYGRELEIEVNGK